jgi:hypothetical protein
MKSLYESILDDEDVLIQNVRTLNWFVIIERMFLEGESEQDMLKFLNSNTVVNNIRPMFKNFKDMKWKYFENKLVKVFTLHYVKETENYGGSTDILSVSIRYPKWNELNIHISDPYGYFPEITKNNIKLDKFEKWKKQIVDNWVFKTSFKGQYELKNKH